MAFTQAELDFINSPDSVDFVTRQNSYFIEHARNDPGIVIAQTLTGGYLLCYIHRDEIESLATVLGPGFATTESIVLGTLVDSPLDASGITQIYNQPYLDLDGQDVLVGIVDTGIDFTQPAFIRDDGTSKIRYLYDQSVIGNAPEGFATGTEYTNEQINEALKSQNPYDIVPQRDTSGHGTFIASIAAGRKVDGFAGTARDADIIAVKLPLAKPFYLEAFFVPPTQHDAFSSSSVMVGVEYILQKARELGKPVAICIGLGTNFGGHDGFSVFAEYLGGIASQKGVCLCTAAGNESQARHHMEGKLKAAGDTQNVDIRVGDDAGDVMISLWNTISDRLSVAIRSPSGELVSRVTAKAGPSTVTKLVLERSVVVVRYFLPVEVSGAQLTVVQIRNATPGLWTIIVHGDIVLDGTFHGWLPLTGFVHESVEFLSASPYYTITSPGTMLNSICCGAYNSYNNSLYINSSWGPTRTPAMAPDLVAPGVNVLGYLPSGPKALSGTSIAAAITTGACALLLQWGIIEENDVAMSTYQIRAYLIRGCSRSTAMSYPNTQWGYGKLDLMQTFHMMREL